MTDPKRWLEDRAAASTLEARILAAGTELTPPPGLMEQGLAEFAGLVGVANAGHGPSLSAGKAAGAGQSAGLSTGAATGGASLTAAVLKAVGVGLLLGTLTMTSARFLGRESPDAARPLAAGSALPVAALPGAPAAERTERVLVVPDSAKLPEQAREKGELRDNEPASRVARAALDGESSSQALSEGLTGAAATSAAFPVEPATAQGAAASSASPSAQNNALRAEALELAQAKNLLQQGLASEALTLLVGGTKRFARGVLSDERELLTVQALSALGRREQARQRALAFLASHGHSPISLRMQRLIDKQ
jgi:hypothetical protein